MAGERMRPLAGAPAERLRRVRFVLTDMDDTLTYHGALAAETYTALERLRRGGVPVIPVTAAPAGWCDQMARMWPIGGVIGENGGFYFDSPGGGAVTRRFWHPEPERAVAAARLDALAAVIAQRVPAARIASDQPFRLTSLAYDAPADGGVRDALVAAFRDAGARVTVNSLWVLGWFGDYDKLAMARRVMAEVHGLSIDDRGDEILYVGDSTNDAPMFAFFDNSVGVSTVVDFLPHLPVPPTWVTRGPGGAGFVEVAGGILQAKG